MVAAAPLEERVRRICLDLPGTEERLSHGSPAFFAGRQFLMLWPDGHHDHHFPHLWCAGLPGAQEHLLSGGGERYFRPPYVGGRGWVGFRLDGTVDWTEVESLCEDAFRAIAPKRLLARLETSG